MRSAYEVVREWGQNLHKLNCNAFAYIIESRKQQKGQFWFGLDKRILDRYGNRNLHILFVCGSADKVITLPSPILQSLLSDLEVAAGNRYHVHIFERQDRFELALAGKGHFDVTPYMNLFDFTPTLFRSKTIAQIKPPSRMEKEKDESEKVEQPVEMTIEELVKRLAEDARASDEPEKFETTLKSCLETLGLKCERRGKAGDTDLLITEPFSAIVDAKTTAKPPLAKVNFDRIIEHKEIYGVEFAAIVAASFSPAICRGAKRNCVALIEVHTLQHLLKLNAIYPIPTYFFGKVFAVHGLVERQYLAEIEAELEEAKSNIVAVLEIAKALDNRPRELAEISGRLEVILERNNKPPLPREKLALLLNVFSTPPFAIFHRSGNLYSRLLSLEQAIKRIQSAATFMIEAIQQSG
ncbi:MAG: hypothetical protein NZ805_05005 [Armatimonadetes bacterium]|nr:hypothetical protein [Armatimonadota bacterium]MDW8028811.1 hypothetical protein [Armatimonadota bacterium]